MLLVAWCAPHQALAEETASATSVEELLESRMPRAQTLEEAQQQVERLRQMLWMAADGPGSNTVDQNGNSLADDLAAMVLREDVDRAIKAATDKETITSLLMTESVRMFLLLYYWSFVEHTAVHDTYLEPLLSTATAQDAENARARLAAARARANGVRTAAGRALPGVALAAEAEQHTQAMQSLLDAYNAVRTELVAKQSQMATDQPPVRPYLQRTAPCPAPNTPEGPNSAPRKVQGVILDDYYPAEMKRHGVEGVARVEVAVSATGCITAARIQQSSGAPPLDEAAVQVALHAHTNPAGRNGKAVAVTTGLPMRFKLDSEPAQTEASGRPAPPP